MTRTGASTAPRADGDAWDKTSPELQYIHDTLLTALPSIEDPRLSGVRR